VANKNSTTTQARDAQVIVGIQKHLLNTPSLPLAGTAITPADLVKLVQSRIDAAGTTAAASANWHSSVVAEKAVSAKLTPILRGLRQFVLNTFGETSPVLADFGFNAPKRATLTSDEKAAAAAKALATRKARGTLGKNQRKEIKAPVPAAAPSPVSTPTTPTPTATAPSQGSTGPRTA
jgi:hypothetical protein